jgi:hypothetical protein
VVIASFFFGKTRTQLDLSYLSQSHQDGHSTAFFVISNAGNQGLTCDTSGRLEFSGQSTATDIRFEAKLLELPPGVAETVQVPLPDVMDKPWRFTIYYGWRNTTSLRAHQSHSVSSEWIKESPKTAQAPTQTFCQSVR